MVQLDQLPQRPKVHLPHKLVKYIWLPSILPAFYMQFLQNLKPLEKKDDCTT